MQTATAETALAKPRIRVPAMSRGMMAAAAGQSAYSGASNANANISLWRPPLRSVDAEIFRDAAPVRSRARDLERNHPYARQAIRVSRLGVVGKKLRYSCRPDWRFLGIDQDEAVRWGQEFERIWENYAHGPQCLIDAGRRLNFTQMMALEHDCEFRDGEFLTTAEWAPNRKWRTCFQVVDVDRLSNPNGNPETSTRKGGVELNDLSEPLGYWVRDTHPADVALFDGRQQHWSYIARETQWGRSVVQHGYEHQRPGQTRGMSEFASVIATMKMGAEYTETALQAAILQASYAAVLQSQQNYKEALEIINMGDPSKSEETSIAALAEENLASALEYHDAINLRFQGAQVPILWPGEELKLLTPGQTATSLGEFQSAATKSYSAGTGTDPISVSQDYSNVNYSSAKMAVASNFRHYDTRRERLNHCSAMPKVGAFLEEAVFSGQLDLPKGVSPLDFYDARDALINGTFLTQGAPNLDPLKEINALEKEMTHGITTLQEACARKGVDYLDHLDQMARERADKEVRGLADEQAAGAV